MKAEFERTMPQEMKVAIENAAAMYSLDRAQRFISGLFPTLFIYKGGSHIAIHLKEEGPRYAIITE
jgi:hypothetical protein